MKGLNSIIMLALLLLRVCVCVGRWVRVCVCVCVCVRACVRVSMRNELRVSIGLSERPGHLRDGAPLIIFYYY